MKTYVLLAAEMMVTRRIMLVLTPSKAAKLLTRLVEKNDAGVTGGKLNESTSNGAILRSITDTPSIAK